MITMGHHLPVSGSRVRVLLAIAVIGLALSGCASPAWSDASYHGKAIRSAQDMGSAVATAQIAGRQYLDGRLSSAAADTIVSDAEQDAQGILSAFGTRQPPGSASQKLLHQFDPLLQQAANNLTDLRIALRADDRTGISRALDDLAAVSPKLKKLAGQP